MLGDYNFPFIQWPSKTIYRNQEPEERASEKVQGKMLLDFAESNFMEQYIYDTNSIEQHFRFNFHK